MKTLQVVQNGRFSTAAILAVATALGFADARAADYQRDFALAECTLNTTGRNAYFVLEPGFQLVLEGGGDRLEVTVLDETETVDGVVTRIVEEREWKDGELYEISRNFFAICEETKDVYYFGETVDFYEGGKVTNHEGSWRAGENNARAGLIMPATPALGFRYYQEIAPDVAMDRAEIVDLDGTCETPAGKFSNCMEIREGTALNIFVREYKYYAPDVGLIRDEDLQLTSFGVVKR